MSVPNESTGSSSTFTGPPENLNDEQKFEDVLNVFLRSNFRVNNDVYLEMLLSHLSKKNEKDQRNMLSAPIILKYIENAIDKWESDDPPSARIITFTLRLLALVIEDEWKFVTFKENKLFDRIQVCMEHPAMNNPAIKLANVILFKSIVKHSLGVHWIKHGKHWRTIVSYCLHNHTIYVVQAAQEFMFTFLHIICTQLQDDSTCNEILLEIMEPVTSNVYDQTKTTVYVDCSEIQNKVAPVIELLSNIMKRCIEPDAGNKIPLLIEKQTDFELNLWKLCSMNQDHSFLAKVLRTHVYLNFALLEFSDDTIVNFDQFGVRFYNHINFCIKRHSEVVLLELVDLNCRLWRCLGDRAPKEVMLDSHMIDFKAQLVICQMVPPVMVIMRVRVLDQQFDEEFVLKLFQVSSELTVRVGYAFRDICHSKTDNAMYDLACKSINKMMGMIDFLDQSLAVIVFQCIVYILNDFNEECAPGVGHNEDISNWISKYKKIGTDWLLQTPNLLTAMLNAVYMLVKRFKITWKESLRTTSLLNFMLALLANPNLMPTQAIQALKLTQLSIEQFLVPNLALLVDTLSGSGMEDLGPMIVKRLHDFNWEVRDSTLELLTSIAAISNLKFPAFQQHILENSIIPIVLEMAKSDDSSFVRTSALACLTTMVKVKSFWERCLSSTDLIPHVLSVLYNESEGIVRREAVCLIAAIYDNQKFPQKLLDQLFSTMAYSSVNDLHWEVKTGSLVFWRSVMCRQFQHQGMIDGTFPTVTFSREHKKIVTLTPKEIVLRLSKILNELSIRGCLGVLLECLQDDCDLEVVKQAVPLCKQLFVYLNKYDYLDTCLNKKLPNGQSSNPVIDTNYSELPMKSCAKGDIDSGTRNNADVSNHEEVIESIVGAHDINLLACAYASQLKVDENKKESSASEVDDGIDAMYYKKFTVTPEKFLQTTLALDLDRLIKDRTDWIMQTDSFGSLLDDILYSSKDEDVNNMDCY